MKRKRKSKPKLPAEPVAGKRRARLDVVWTKRAAEDRDYWRLADERIARRIDSLIADVLDHPITGIGKPEPLKRNFSGYWSRRITDEHRLVYRIAAGTLFVLQCRYHY